ncbi:MAG: hypothetical protein DMF63_08710 [Acidobacteria bacterium]|nr:MAG: hypothetical protein DMF63_08710 [Acidobacteriota bacterium]
MMRKSLLSFLLWNAALCALVSGQENEPAGPGLVELVVEAGHSSQIDSLWLNKNETRLVSSSADRIVIWDFNSRRELRAIKDGGLAGVSADDSVLMTNSDSYDLWDLRTGNKLFSVKDVTTCAFQLIGANLVCHGSDGMFTTRDGLSGEILSTFTSPEKHSLNFAFGHRNRVITGGVQNDVEENPKQLGTVRIWDASKQFLSLENVQSWGASSDGKRLIIVYSSGELSVLDISATPTTIFSLSGAKGFSLSPDGRFILVNDDVWDIDRKVKTFTAPAANDATLKTDVSSKWFTLERSNGDASSSEFRSFANGELRLTVKVDSSFWRLSQNERFIVEQARSGDLNYLLNVYDIETGRKLNKSGIPFSYGSELASVVVTDDGKKLILDKSDNIGSGRQRDIVAINLANGTTESVYSAPDVEPLVTPPSTIMMRQQTGELKERVFQFSADNKQIDQSNRNLVRERKISLASQGNDLLYGPMDSRILLVNWLQRKIQAQFESRGMSILVDLYSDKKIIDISAFSNYRKHRNKLDPTTGEIVSFSELPSGPLQEVDENTTGMPDWSKRYEAELGADYNQDEKNSIPVGEFVVKEKASGKEIFKQSNVTNYEFTDDGKYLALFKKEPDDQDLEAVQVFDFANKRVIFSKSKIQRSSYINSLSPDGKALLLSSVNPEGRSLDVWDLLSKLRVRTYPDVTRSEFIDNGKALVLFKVAQSANKGARPIGTLEIRNFVTDSLMVSHDRVSEYEFNEDHSHLLVYRPSPTRVSTSDAELWNLKKNELVRRSGGIRSNGSYNGFSRRKDYVFTEKISSGTQPKTIQLEIFDLEGSTLFRSGNELVQYIVDSEGANFILEYLDRIEWHNIVSNESRTFLFGKNFKFELDLGLEVLVSPNNKHIAFSYNHRDRGQNYFAVWDLEKNWVNTRAPHAANVTNVIFSPDDRFLISSSDDGSAKWWALENGVKEALTFVPLDEDNWVVTDPSGRFDTSFSLDDVKGIHWNVGTQKESVPLEAYMRQYFSPGLLRSVLRCNAQVEDDGSNTCDKEFKPLPSIAELNRVQAKLGKPVVSAIKADGTVDVTVAVESITEEVTVSADRAQKAKRTSGAFDLRLFLDGQLIGTSTPKERQEKYIANAPANVAAGKPSDKVMDSPDDRAWRSANNILDIRSENIKQISPTKAEVAFRNIKLPRDGRSGVEFSAYAFNTDRVKSETVRRALKIENPQTKKGKAYVISIGVNASDNRNFDLKYAANDARKMQEVLGSRLATSQFSEVINIPLISERSSSQSPGASNARKAVIKAVFSLLAGRANEVPTEIMTQIPDAAKIAPVEPEDTLIITYAGHGYADRSGIFYLLPEDIGVDTSELTTKNLNRMISSDELSLWMQDVTAAEMIMVIDACHSSSAVQGDGFKPGPMGSRGLGQLAYDKGMKILSATQADNVALELGNLKQGLLSYVLLEDGVIAKKADSGTAPDGKLTPSEWLGYAVNAVPKLYQDVLEGKRAINVGGNTVDVSKVPPAQRDVTVYGADPQDRKSMVQQPSVFDFRRKKDERPMITLR